MDEITARITEYVIEILPALENDEKLPQYVDDVMMRAMIFMNRDRYIDAYNEAIEDLEEGEELDYYVVVPIPRNLERVIARAIVDNYKTITAQGETGKRAVTSVKDQNQTVSFSDKMISFFNSSSESDIFSGSLSLLRRYMLPITRDAHRSNRF